MPLGLVVGMCCARQGARIGPQLRILPPEQGDNTPEFMSVTSCNRLTGSSTLLAISPITYRIMSLWTRSLDSEFRWNLAGTTMKASTICPWSSGRKEWIDCLLATDIGMVPPKCPVEAEWEWEEVSSLEFHHISFVVYIDQHQMLWLSFCQKGTKCSRVGTPPSSRLTLRWRGVRVCHTLNTVNTVWLK